MRNLRKHFAAPLSRRRLYIYLIREDVLAFPPDQFHDALKERLSTMLDGFNMEVRTPWFLDLYKVFKIILNKQVG